MLQLVSSRGSGVLCRAHAQSREALELTCPYLVVGQPNSFSWVLISSASMAACRTAGCCWYRAVTDQFWSPHRRATWPAFRCLYMKSGPLQQTAKPILHDTQQALACSRVAARAGGTAQAAGLQQHSPATRCHCLLQLWQQDSGLHGHPSKKNSQGPLQGLACSSCCAKAVLCTKHTPSWTLTCFSWWDTGLHGKCMMPAQSSCCPQRGGQHSALTQA